MNLLEGALVEECLGHNIDPWGALLGGHHYACCLTEGGTIPLGASFLDS